MQDKTEITKESLDALIRQWHADPANADKQIPKIDDLMQKEFISLNNINQDDEYKLLQSFIKTQIYLSELKILCRRLYSPVDDKKQIEFTGTLEEQQKKKFLVHALLTNILYNILQECEISYQFKNCILDGTVAAAISIDALLDWFKKGGNTNPYTREQVKEETLYYIRCIKPGFNLGKASDIFNQDNFAKYEVAYAEAQEILKKMLLNQSINDEILQILPPDVYKVLKKPLPDVVIINFINELVQNSDSANEINNLLKEYKFRLPIIKKLIDSQQYQAKFTASGEDILENFRNFVIKCVLAIMHCIKFWFTTESPSQRFNYYKDDCKKDAIPEELKNFKSYIADSLKKEFELPLN